MIESLESQIISKMNKIVNKYELEIKIERNDVRGKYIKLQHKTFDWNYVIWPDLHTLLFSSDQYYSLVQWIQINMDPSPKQDLQQRVLQSNLLSVLSGVSSLEEVLLKLNILYPDTRRLQISRL